MIKKLFNYAKKEKNNYFEKYPYDNYKFIWGIKAHDDLTGSSKADFFTLNDLDIVYDKESKTYRLSIETVYQFSDLEKGEKRYIKNLLEQFTKWMDENKYNTKGKLDLYDIFTMGANVNTEFESIEHLYTTFKFLVNSFVESDRNK